MLALAFLAGSAPVGAQAGFGDENGFVDVIEVNGLIDPVLAEFVQRSLDQAEVAGARAVVLQMESAGVAVDDATLDRLIDQIGTSEIPVSVWLGPAGKGAARGRAAELALASSRIGVSPGSEIEFADGPARGYDDMLEDGSVLGVPVQDAPALLNHLLELPEFDFRVYEPGERVPNGPIVGDEIGDDGIEVHIGQTPVRARREIGGRLDLATEEIGIDRQQPGLFRQAHLLGEVAVELQHRHAIEFVGVGRYQQGLGPQDHRRPAVAEREVLVDLFTDLGERVPPALQNQTEDSRCDAVQFR